MPYAILEMNGTAAMVATMATEHIIIASLNRHGKRFVQCFVFSNIDISVFPKKAAYVTVRDLWRARKESNIRPTGLKGQALYTLFF